MNFNCTDQGPNPVEFRVLDAGGNESNPPICSATITVVDDLPPVAQCQDITVDLNLPVGPSPDNVDVFATQINNGSMDNCTNPLTDFTIRKGTSGPFMAIGVPVNFECDELGPNLVELRVGDGNGNPNFCTATVTVRDVTAPTPMCNPVIFDLDAMTGTLNLLDPDPSAILTTGSGVVNVPIPDPGVLTHTLNVPTSGLIGDLDVVLKINHTWVGDLDVVLTSPKGTSVSLFDRPGVPNTTFGCASDDIDVTFDDEALLTAADLEITCNAPPAISGDYQSIDLLSAFDGENMLGDWVLTITDNFGADVGTLVEWSLITTDNYLTKLGIGSTDNCCVQWTTNKLTYDCSNVNFGFGGNGPLTYTLTVYDSNADGNAETATCTQSITIRDVTDPVAVCPAPPIKVYLDALGNVNVPASLVGAGSTDNCSIDGYLIRRVTGGPGGTGQYLSSLSYDCDDIGLQSVRLWVDDPSGNPTTNNPPSNPGINVNTVYCANAIKVIDDIAPLAICNAVSVALGSDGMVTIPAFSVSLGSTDNCSACILTREISMDGGPWGPNAVYICDSLGSRDVAVRITDCNNNSAICTTTITIQDNEVPTLTCPTMKTV